MSKEEASGREKKIQQQALQKKTFTRWVNTHLADRQLEMADLVGDMANGVYFLNLLEIISGQKIPKWSKTPRRHIEQLENLNKGLEFLKEEGIKLVNIGSTDLNTGNLTIVLGLIWTLILKYQIQKSKDSTEKKSKSPKDELLEWVNKQINPKVVNNFSSDWTDSTALVALVNSIVPGAVNPNGNALEDTEQAMKVANDRLAIPRVIDSADLCANPDELSVMTYVSYFREAQARLAASPGADAKQSYAEGSGLDGASVADDEPAKFNVHSLSVVGLPVKPNSAVVLIKQPDGTELKADIGPVSDDGVFSVKYKPTAIGTHTIDVQLEGNSVRNTPVQVEVGSGADPASSYAIGRGLTKATDNDKQPATFKVHSLAPSGKPVKPRDCSVEVLGPDGAPLNSVTIEEAEYGVFTVGWRPSTVGEHTITVKLDGQQIKDMPSKATVIRGAVASKTHRAHFKFTIWAVMPDDTEDSKGDQHFEVTVADVAGVPIPVKTSDNGDGSYTAEYDLKFTHGPGVDKSKHNWTVNCMLNGEHVPGSPFEHDMTGEKAVADGPLVLHESGEVSLSRPTKAPKRSVIQVGSQNPLYM